MGILEITGLAHAFGDKALYHQSDLSLFKGEHMGIVGQNGSGKSTLLKILLGEIIPNEGLIAWQRGISIGHLDQYAEVDGALSIDAYLHTAFADLYQMEQALQALYLQMDANATEKQMAQAARYQETLLARNFYAIDSEIARVAAGLGLPAIGMQRTLSTLSGGQRAKVILAKLLLARPVVLLLDEPTNFLDAEHIQWLSAFLRAFSGAFMIVSHDFAFLDSITNCICDIEFQALKKYHGAYADFVRQKEHLRAEYLRRYQAQQREVEKLEDYIARNKVRAATARMAKSRQKKLDKMDRLAPTTVLPKPNIQFAPMTLTASRALELHGLRVGYDAPLLPPLTLRVAGGTTTVITGFNGIGKSTLLKTLMGQLPALGGSFAFDPAVRLAYFAQDLAWENGELSPLQLLAAAYPKAHPRQHRRQLARYGVRAEHVMRPIRTLSGGEQNKVKLCLLSMQASNFLILDEPTNHLDAETKESLQEAIAQFQGNVILVCHEPAFYQAFADQVVDMERMLG